MTSQSGTDLRTKSCDRKAGLRRCSHESQVQLAATECCSMHKYPMIAAAVLADMIECACSGLKLVEITGIGRKSGDAFGPQNKLR